MTAFSLTEATTLRCRCGRIACERFDEMAVCRSCWEDLSALQSGQWCYAPPGALVQLGWLLLGGCALLGVIGVATQAIGAFLR